MQEQANAELKKIDLLLRDISYNKSMAKIIEAAYGYTTDKAKQDSSTITISIKEEKVATNISGFYALECGLDMICSRTHETPFNVLKTICNNQVDFNTFFLLDRFANATWKAAQPFKDIKRITRPTFTIANFLPYTDLVKDRVQIKNASNKLLTSLETVKNSNKEEQTQMIKSLMQNQSFTSEMAQTLHAGYYTAQNQKPEDFLLKQDNTTMISKQTTEQNIAKNIASFYALECGLSYIAAKENILPSTIMQSIINDSLYSEYKDLFMRFANATWKAGQPFTGLKNIEKQNFVPFSLLINNEKQKDWLLIKASAEKLLNDMK